MNTQAARSLAVLLGLCVSGCALLGKSEALSPRYFSPDSAPPTASAARSPTPTTAVELALGRVTAAAHLGERIVYRDSSHELNFYDERRWSEKPEAYLRRALARSLFEQRGLRRLVSGIGPTLDVELTEFAEVRGDSPSARVAATFLLYDQRQVRRQASVYVELPLARKAPPEVVARTLTDALSRAVDLMTTQVMTELQTQ
ncbi:MAG TPA: ABC-type transport auxiliary lipoprotein family protein, partial [Polyangiales bacterium]|nr:ABC-type transport auxiliary lipoprotein family protein [Polyangiales bacterium]